MWLSIWYPEPEFPAGQTPPYARGRPAARLTLEALEDRMLLVRTSIADTSSASPYGGLVVSDQRRRASAVAVLKPADRPSTGPRPTGG